MVSTSLCSLLSFPPPQCSFFKLSGTGSFRAVLMADWEKFSVLPHPGHRAPSPSLWKQQCLKLQSWSNLWISLFLVEVEEQCPGIHVWFHTQMNIWMCGSGRCAHEPHLQHQLEPRLGGRRKQNKDVIIGLKTFWYELNLSNNFPLLQPEIFPVFGAGC